MFWYLTLTFIVYQMRVGTALESLSSMQSFLRGRPQRFESLERGIEYW